MKALIWVSVFALMGCGDDSSESESVCSLKGSLTGTVNQSVDWNDANGCAAASSGTLLTFTFGAFQSDSIVIGTSGEAGVLATGVDAYVMYRDANGAEWNNQNCLVDFTRNDAVADGDYIMGGTATCQGPATPFGGGAQGEINYGPLTFTVQVPF
ncbi:MAG: hypothetical protein R3E66_05890 [bacterium]